MAHAIQIPRFGGPEVLRRVEIPAPVAGAGEALISVRAAGVNFADLMMRMGSYPDAPRRPFTPGYEVAGVVSAVGPAAGAATLRAGDRVVAASRFGGYASELVVPAEQAWRIPEGLSFEEAAAIPVNFITAWIALEEMARVRAGDRILIHSAAGGVGVAAVQLAARRGAAVSGLTRSPQSKGDFIRGLGAREVISVADWESADDSRFGRFDAILDATGGESFKRSFRRLAPAGRLVQFGVSRLVTGRRRSVPAAISTLARMPFYHPVSLMNANRGVFGLNVLNLFDPDKRALPARAMSAVLELFAKGELRVVVGRTFPLAEAGAAHSYLQSGEAKGKVVLVC